MGYGFKMNLKSFNLVSCTILLIKYAVKADAALETLDAFGTKCSTKLSLCELDPSKITSLGLKGDKGEMGPKGETGFCVGGPVGFGGAWPLGDDDEEEPDGTDDGKAKISKPEWGTIENPGKTTCKNAPIEKTGTYYVYNSIEVECDVNRKTTCVKIKATPLEVSFSGMNSSWLSTSGIEYGDIYSLSNSQLRWLQARSDTASIKIRYQCVNTSPARKGREVQLLSWNDAIIGPVPTASSPIHYKFENDRCSTAPVDKWSFTDIVIKNTSAHRLPIIDFYIQDNMIEDQKHKISVTELCFH